MSRPARRRSTVRGVAALATAALLATGCSAASEGADDASVEATADAAASAAVQVEPTPTPTPTPTSTPTPTPTPAGPVTIAIGGDVHFEGQIRALVTSDPDGALDEIAPVLSDADIAIVNLETAITDGGNAAPKQYVFAGPTEGLDALEAAGVDVVSLANNHGMDRGEVGLLDTLDAAEDAGLELVGAGRDADEAYGPWTTEVAGRRIAVLGATQVLDSFALTAWLAEDDKPGLASAKEEGIDQLVEAVEEAAEDADTVVVNLHWGREGESCPLPRQEELARQLVDAGADVIVGGHAHRLQAGGHLGDAYVHYGLGNFVFYSSAPPGTTSGVLEVEIAPDDAITARWLPAEIRGGVPVPLDGDAADAAVREWESLRSCADLEASA